MKSLEHHPFVAAVSLTTGLSIACACATQLCGASLADNGKSTLHYRFLSSLRMNFPFLALLRIDVHNIPLQSLEFLISRRYQSPIAIKIPGCNNVQRCIATDAFSRVVFSERSTSTAAAVKCFFFSSSPSASLPKKDICRNVVEMDRLLHDACADFEKGRGVWEELKRLPRQRTSQSQRMRSKTHTHTHKIALERRPAKQAGVPSGAEEAKTLQHGRWK